MAGAERRQPPGVCLVDTFVPHPAPLDPARPQLLPGLPAVIWLFPKHTKLGSRFLAFAPAVAATNALLQVSVPKCHLLGNMLWT